jgi:hypothetical protein
MPCVECGVRPQPEDRGWVLVLPAPDEPRVCYCPDCIAELVGGATRTDEQEKDGDGGAVA